MKHVCSVCAYTFDEAVEGVPWDDLPDDWVCPVGITTQDPELRSHVNIEPSAQRLENFLNGTTHEFKDFARLTGHGDVHHLSTDDLRTTNSEIVRYTPIAHAGE